MIETIAVGVGATDCMMPGGLALTKIALSRCSFPPGARLLDIGCGAAYTLEHLIGWDFNALGIDPSLAALRQGIEKNRSMPLLSAVGEDLPLAPSTFDGVLAECVLSITRDRDRVLGECRRVLKANGRIILSDLYATNPGGMNAVHSLPPSGCLAHILTRDELLDKLNDHGFQPSFWEDRSHALRAFVAQLVFSYGSAEKFWCRIAQGNGDPANSQKLKEVITRVRPGYFLLVAQKTER